MEMNTKKTQRQNKSRMRGEKKMREPYKAHKSGWRQKKKI